MMKLSHLLIAAIIGSNSLFATTYYLSPTGNNTSAGTSIAPWKTFAVAVPKLQVGDTLRVKPGTYLETAKVSIKKSNVTIKADDPTNRPTINFNDRNNAYGRYVDSYGQSNISWDGVNITNAGGAEKGAINFGYWYASNTGTRMTNWVIKNCDITYAYNAAIRWMHCDSILIENVYTYECAQLNANRKNLNNHPHIILGYWSDNVIQRNCRVIQNHGEGIGPYIGCSNWLIENCEVADNYKINIYIDTEIGDCIVRNNLVYGTDYYVAGGTTDQRPNGVRLANEISDFNAWGGVYDITKFLVQNVHVYNNMIINCNKGIEACPYLNGPFTLNNSSIMNNTIVADLASDSLGFNFTVPGNYEVSNNIVFNTTGLLIPGNITAINNFTNDPIFVEGTGLLAENYKLAENSPCIDASATSALFTTDYFGIARPEGAGYDIGAHEYKIPNAINPNKYTNSKIEFTLSPNPAGDYVNINTNLASDSKITVYDYTGKIIYAADISSFESLHTIPTQNWRNGVYMVNLKSKNATSTSKLIIN